MSALVRLFIPGQPVPQPRARITARNGFAHGYVPASHPIHAYRANIQKAAREANIVLTGAPVSVTISAVFERPKSHWTKTGFSKAAKPLPKPDADNVAKGVLDALTGIAWRDDSQVVLQSYKSYGMTPHTEITIEMKPVHRNMIPTYAAQLGLHGTFVEVGVATGTFMEIILATWPYKYIGVDRWRHVPGYDDSANVDQEQQEKRYSHCIELAKKAGQRASVLRLDSCIAASTFEDKSLDVVYIDAEHTFDAVVRDIQAWAPKIRQGGLLCGHDYYNKFPFEVRKAVAAIGGPCGITHEPAPSWWCNIG